MTPARGFVRSWWPVLALALAAALVLGVCYLRPRPTPGGNTPARDSAVVRVDRARLEALRLETVYVARVDTVRQQVVRYERLRDTLRLAAPVVTARGDSVRVDTLPAVVALRQAADSVVLACTAAIGAADARIAAERSRCAADRRLLELDHATALAAARATGERRGWRKAWTIVGVAAAAVAGAAVVAR